jgi:hypothetical protein
MVAAYNYDSLAAWVEAQGGTPWQATRRPDNPKKFRLLYWYKSDMEWGSALYCEEWLQHTTAFVAIAEPGDEGLLTRFGTPTGYSEQKKGVRLTKIYDWPGLLQWVTDEILRRERRPFSGWGRGPGHHPPPTALRSGSVTDDS